VLQGLVLPCNVRHSIDIQRWSGLFSFRPSHVHRPVLWKGPPNKSIPLVRPSTDPDSAECRSETVHRGKGIMPPPPRLASKSHHRGHDSPVNHVATRTHWRRAPLDSPGAQDTFPPSRPVRRGLNAGPSWTMSTAVPWRLRTTMDTTHGPHWHQEKRQWLQAW
jgi:hypothetical protein